MARYNVVIETRQKDGGGFAAEVVEPKSYSGWRLDRPVRQDAFSDLRYEIRQALHWLASDLDFLHAEA